MVDSPRSLAIYAPNKQYHVLALIRMCSSLILTRDEDATQGHWAVGKTGVKFSNIDWRIQRNLFLI